MMIFYLLYQINLIFLLYTRVSHMFVALGGPAHSMPENHVQRVEQVKVVVAESVSRVCLITALTVCGRNYALNKQLA